MLCLPSLLPAQDAPTLKTTVRLVNIPTAVSDSKGRPVEGLTEPDFEVTDNGNPRHVHVTLSQDSMAPVSLVVAIESSDMTSAAMAKIRKIGTMIPDAVAGANAQVAVVTYDEHVRLIQNFTGNSGELSNAFRSLHTGDSERARMIDAVSFSIELLQMRKNSQRSSILVVGETRDRGSESELNDVMDRAQRAGITVYGLNYSAYLTPFTAKPDDYQPASGGMPNLLAAITETARLARRNTIDALVTATGGTRYKFITQSKLENDLIGLGRELHSRYLIAFTPGENAVPGFHKLEIRIKQKPGATIHAAPGYWMDAE